MGACCSCKPQHRYERMIQGIYPKKPGGAINTGMQGKLTNYASANPEKLPKIGRAFEKRVRNDAKRRRWPFVTIGLRSMIDVVHATPDKLSLYIGNLVSSLTLAFAQNVPGLDLACCEAIATVATYLEEVPNVRDFDVFIPHLTRVAVSTTEPIEEQYRLRHAALVALAKLASSTDSHVLQYVDIIVGAAVPNLSLGTDSATAVRNAAGDCIAQLSRQCTATTMKDLLKSMFAVLDSLSFWTFNSGTVALQALLAALRGMRGQYGYTFVAGILIHAEPRVRQPDVVRPILAVVPEVIAQVRGPSGPRSFEPVAVLMRLLLAGDAAVQTSVLNCLDALARKPHHEAQNLEFIALLLQPLQRPTDVLVSERLLRAARVIAGAPTVLPVGKYFPETVLQPLLSCMGHAHDGVARAAVDVLRACFMVNGSRRPTSIRTSSLSDEVAPADAAGVAKDKDVDKQKEREREARDAPLAKENSMEKTKEGESGAASAGGEQQRQHSVSRGQLLSIHRAVKEALLKPHIEVEVLLELHALLLLLASEYKVKAVEFGVPLSFIVQDYCLSAADTGSISVGQSLVLLTSVAAYLGALGRILRAGQLSKYVSEIVEKRRKASQIPSFLNISPLYDLQLCEPVVDLSAHVSSGTVDTPVNREFVVKTLLRIEAVSDILTEDSLMRTSLDHKDTVHPSSGDLSIMPVSDSGVEFETDTETESEQAEPETPGITGSATAGSFTAASPGVKRVPNFSKLTRNCGTRIDIFEGDGMQLMKAFLADDSVVVKITDIVLPSEEVYDYPC